MPRILVHVSLEHPGDAWGGISSALDLLVAAGSEKGQQVAVLSIGGSDAVKPLADGVTLHIVGMPELQGRVLYRHPDRVGLAQLACERLAVRLADLHGSSEVDLCLHNDELVHLAEICASRPWLRTCVAFVHGLARQEHPMRPDLHKQQDDLIERVQAIAVFSHAYAGVVRSFYPDANNIEVVTPPLALLSERAARKRLQRPSVVTPRTVLAAGRSVPQKGFDIYLRALALIPPGSIKQGILITGHGDISYRREYTALANESAVPIRIRPWAGRPSLSRAMASAHAVIVPSRFEPLGLVAAEALALGVPVVASAVGGLAEMICTSSAGRTVLANDGAGPTSADLADAILATVDVPPGLSSGPACLQRWTVDACRCDLNRLLEGT